MIPYTAIYEVTVLSLAIAAVSTTITRAMIFAPVREDIADRNEWLGELFACPYCLSHWLAGAAVLIVLPDLLPGTLKLISLIVAVFTIVTLSSWATGLIIRAFATTPPPVDD
jgi:uncharacterized membrane protein